MRAAAAAGSGRLVLYNVNALIIVSLSETRLAAFLSGQASVADEVAVACLGVDCGPPRIARARKGNFKSLYFLNDLLACRQCHRLRCQTTLTAPVLERRRIARLKLIHKMRGDAEGNTLYRQRFAWRCRHAQLAQKLDNLDGFHYETVCDWLSRFKCESNVTCT